MLNSYDQVIYHSYSRSETHPARISSLAKIFNLQAPAITSARVLELGAGTGGNLIPMAAHLPGSTFLGIDLSAKQILSGQKMIKDLSLTNIELKVQSILDFGDDAGLFDYIICHGVFSWVSLDVQNKILEIFSNHLSPNGLGYISYNTFPGWKVKSAWREMMQYHTSAIEDPEEKFLQAKALLRFLSENQTVQSDPYAQSLQQISKELQTAPSYYLFHEYLEEENNPLYFYQFTQKLNSFDLAYVGDAHFGLMSGSDLPEEAQLILEGVGDREQYEQYLDFLRNRKLRESIICHASANIEYPAEASRLIGALLSADLKLDREDCLESEGKISVFTTKGGGEIQTSNPLAIASLNYLGEHYPEQIPFSSLIAEVAKEQELDLASPIGMEMKSQLIEDFFVYYSAHLIEVSFFNFGATSSPSVYPLASSFSRAQALVSDRVTSLNHVSNKLEPITRQILALLDGSRDREAIIRELVLQVEQGSLKIGEDSDLSSPQILEILSSIVDQSIALLTKKAYFLDQREP